MPPVDRQNPIRAASSESSHSVMEFMREFPDDESCLTWLWRQRFSTDGEHAECPRCDKLRVFKRYATSDKRPAWYCQSCGHRIHPLKGTIFEKSSTSLHLWFYGMFLMASTRCGISAKQLERELGVTYKTAWRMFNLIRNRVMSQDEEDPLSGEVEADETFIGGKPRAYPKQPKNWHWTRKQIVFGAVERSGRVIAKVIPNSGGPMLRNSIQTYVLPASTVFTDTAPQYLTIDKKGYQHKRINHSQQIYVDGTVHTQTIEGFFGLMKNGLRGVYHSVSAKWLQGYLNEYAWRYNHRDVAGSQFKILLALAARA